MHLIHTVGGIAEHMGGPSRTVTRLCSSIGQLGEQVDLVAGFNRSNDGRLVLPDSNSVRLSLVDSYRFGRIKFYPGFLRTLAEILDGPPRPTLIHDHGIWAHNNVASWWAARSRQIPYILSPRGMLEPGALEFRAHKKRPAWFFYQQRIVATAAAVVAASEKECESVKRLFPTMPVAIIPNGVNLPTRGFALPNKPKADGRSTVLYMSRIHPLKNLTGLLRAWRLLPAEIAKDWRMIVAGPDEDGHAQEVVALTRELGLQNSIELIGAVDEGKKAAVLQSADIFVLPSLSENFGVVVAEAMAYGLPVIATTGTPWQELPRRRCGWWVGPDPESLSGALAEAMGCSFEQRRTMGATGRAFAQEKFSWDGIGASTIAFYEWILGRSSMRPDFVH